MPAKFVEPLNLLIRAWRAPKLLSLFQHNQIYRHPTLDKSTFLVPFLSAPSSMKASFPFFQILVPEAFACSMCASIPSEAHCGLSLLMSTGRAPCRRVPVLYLACLLVLETHLTEELN